MFVNKFIDSVKKKPFLAGVLCFFLIIYFICLIKIQNRDLIFILYFIFNNFIGIVIIISVLMNMNKNIIKIHTDIENDKIINNLSTLNNENLMKLLFKLQERFDKLEKMVQENSKSNNSVSSSELPELIPVNNKKKTKK